MERKITIGNKELRLRSSLFTIIAYKNEFGTDLFQDVSKMDIKDEEGKLFTCGHFDLVICDEAHRSIYNKYKDIYLTYDENNTEYFYEN